MLRGDRYTAAMSDVLKVIHFGDLHVWKKALPPGEWWYPKRWLGPINLLARRAKKFPSDYRKRVVEDIRASDADLVIYSGDFTTLSHPWEFEEAARIFAPLVEKWGERFFAIPGNHDRYTPGTLKHQLLERHLPFAATDRVKRQDIGTWLSLIGVDHSEPLMIRSNGIVRPASQRKLEETCAQAKQDGRAILLVGHFPYATPPEYPETWEHRLIGEDAFAQTVAGIQPLAYLHGHKHVRWAIRPDSSNGVLCLNCGSAGMKSDNPAKQAGFLSFSVAPEKGVSDLKAHRLEDDGVVEELSVQ